MARALWRITLVLLLVAVPILTGCQLIQAPPKPTDSSTADVLRGPYEPQMIAAAPSPGDELYGWEKVAADAQAAKLAQSAQPEAVTVLVSTADVLRAPYDAPALVVVEPAQGALAELYGWEKVAADAQAAKLAQSAQPEAVTVLVSTADVLRAPYDAPALVAVEPAQGALTELYGWEKVAADAQAAKLAQSAPATQPLIATADILRGPYGEMTLVQAPVIMAAVDVPAEPVGYANPDALATTEWLAAHLNDPTVRILDVRRPTGAANFAAAHIPNAQYVDLNVDLMDRNPNRVALDLVGPERFAALMGRLGVANDSTVVVYDAEGGTAAATLWWAMRYYGHDNVRMLNGGLVKWLLEGRETTRAVAHFAPTEFTVNVQPQLLATAQDIELAMQDPTVFLVDARNYDFYVGARCLSAAPRAGHIPGAVAMPARWQVTPDTKTLLPADRLAMSLELKGISPTQRGITYCGNGHLAAFDAFLLYVMGYENVAVYDSSWLEWGVLPGAPVETGCPGCDTL
ncbi:MAG: hypothetical protein BroJett021_28970 [Chloroflexota bacterium]|nr:MAG: hypothetical protein BroJett021_28970 [Chloroflexota bacterium]